MLNNNGTSFAYGYELGVTTGYKLFYFYILLVAMLRVSHKLLGSLHCTIVRLDRDIYFVPVNAYFYKFNNLLFCGCASGKSLKKVERKK
jgi:hypothetical protein